MERLDNQDDGAVMQDLVWGARRWTDDPVGVEITLGQRNLRHGSWRSKAGKETAWLMTLAGVRIPPAVRRTLYVVIPRAISCNSLISQTVIVSSNAPRIA